MAKYYSFIFLLIINSFCYASNENLNLQLQNVIDQARSDYHISALSLSVGLPMQSKINDYVSGTVSIQNKTAINAENLFQVASITKNFTSVLMLQLVGSGKVNLDDPIGKYLPEYPKWKLITIRQLLNHTSGCYDYIDAPNWWENVSAHTEKVWQAKEVLAIAYQHAPYFKPGDGWHYSNTNYVLAGLIIEKVSSQSLIKQMQSLLHNAGLKNSYYLPFVYPKNILSKMVHGYYQTVDQTMINGSWGQGAAALVSTPNQIVIWVQELQLGKIISKPALQSMQSVVAISNGKPAANNLQVPAYGLGIFRMDTPAGLIWFTPGLSSGYRSLWVYLPCDGITFAYSASNSLMGQGTNFHKQMLQQVIETLKSSQTVQQQIKEYQQSTILPTYCKTIKPAAKWGFIGINKPQFSSN